jgi:hypothetical protein
MGRERERSDHDGEKNASLGMSACEYTGMDKKTYLKIENMIIMAIARVLMLQ